MNNIHQLNRMLDNVGLRDGIFGLRLAADGTSGLELKDGTRVYFEYFDGDGRLCIYTPLLPLPDADRQRMQLFAAMLHWNGATGAHGALGIALHPQQAIYRILIETESLTEDKLDRAIDDVLRSSAELRRRLENAMQQSPEGESQSTSLASTAGRRARVTQPGFHRRVQNRQS